jgi:hypothetical protein
LNSAGKWDPKFDYAKSRDLHCKFSITREIPTSQQLTKKCVEAKRKIVNAILPIFLRFTPQGVPASCIPWPEIMEKTKSEYFKAWQKGKTCCDENEMPNKWMTIEYDVSEYLQPRGV